MKAAIMIVITLVLAVIPLYGDDISQPPPTPAEEQPEVLTRGPVHEAFAEPIDLQVQTGLVAPTEPPANIVENPPSDKPAGEQFVWVPGYWAWDSERNSYIWVSGCWRAAPPNMYWVPGYWVKVPEGWEWVAGFWAPVTASQQIEYLPTPPALVDVQPPDSLPSPDSIWVPPCWYWYHDQYILRPGYWLVAQPNWVWVPSHYVWTPRGYVFVAGHWDYLLERRGVLFAPVYFPVPIYERPGFSFSLSIVIDIGNERFSLFTYPRYCHYYFGDYYDDVYISIGVYPRFECVRRYTWYDPIYEHDRWHFRRSDPHWEEHEQSKYDLRRSNRDMRPPKTYHEMETRMDRLPEPQRKDIQMAKPMTAVVADRATPMKFEQIKNGARSNIATKATDVRKFCEERSRWESPAAEQKTVQPVQPPIEHKGPVTQPTEHKEPVPASINRKPTFVPQQEVHLTHAEKVTIPKPPIVGRRQGRGILGKGPPSRPVDEQKTEGRYTHKDRSDHGKNN